jgi:hypothetical protein
MCLLSFAGLYAVERYRHDHRYVSLLIGAACFGAASATRSNGALLSRTYDLLLPDLVSLCLSVLTT